MRRDARLFTVAACAAALVGPLAGSAPASADGLDVRAARVAAASAAGLPVAGAPDGSAVAVWLNRRARSLNAQVVTAWKAPEGPWTSRTLVADLPAWPVRAVDLLAMRAGAGGVAAVLWRVGGSDPREAEDEGSLGREGELHLSLRSPDGVWSDRVLQTTPPGHRLADVSDLLITSGGDVLVAWSVRNSWADPQVATDIHLAEVGPEGVRRSAVLGAGPTERFAYGLGIGDDRRGGAWIAVTTTPSYEHESLGWARWTPAGGFQTLRVPGAVAGVGSAGQLAAGPIVDGAGIARVVKQRMSLDPLFNDNTTSASVLSQDGLGSEVETGDLPITRTPAALKPWLGAGGYAADPSPAIDARGRLVVGAGVTAPESNGAEHVGWDPVGTVWAFTLHSEGRRWDRAVIDPIGIQRGPSRVHLRASAGGSLTAVWAAGFKNASRCDGVAFAADQRADGSWTPRRIVATRRGRRTSSIFDCTGRTWRASFTGGRSNLVALTNGTVLTTASITAPVATRRASARLLVETRSWSEIARRGALSLQCRGLDGTVCTVDLLPDTKALGKSDNETADVGECFDERLTARIGRGRTAPLRLEVPEWCVEVTAPRLRALRVRFIVERPGHLPRVTERRVVLGQR